MNSLDNLLKRLRDEKADQLRLHSGKPPIIVNSGVALELEGPAITSTEAEFHLHALTSTRQRRELREHGHVGLIYTFRKATPFVVTVQLVDEEIRIDIH